MANKKRFHKSTDLVYQWTTIDLPMEDLTFNRYCICITAAPGKTVEDILKEVYEIEEKRERDEIAGRPNDVEASVLMTTLTETDDFVVCLTYSAFVRIAMSPGIWAGQIRKERYRSLAKDLVATRDRDLKCSVT